MSGIWVMILLILFSSIPVLAVYAWFRLAKYEFSIARFLFALLAGAAAFFPALFLQDLLNFSGYGGKGSLFLQVFIRIAFTEEISRLLMLLIFFFISSRLEKAENGQPLTFRVIKNGTATGLVAGFGFAILESAVYGASDTGVLLIRAVTAAPLHGACGSRIGAAAVLFRSNPGQALLRIVTATAIHGIYNFMVAMPGIPSLAAVLIAISALATAVITIHGMAYESASETKKPETV